MTDIEPTADTQLHRALEKNFQRWVDDGCPVTFSYSEDLKIWCASAPVHSAVYGRTIEVARDKALVFLQHLGIKDFREVIKETPHRVMKGTEIGRPPGMTVEEARREIQSLYDAMQKEADQPLAKYIRDYEAQMLEDD